MSVMRRAGATFGIMLVVAACGAGTQQSAASPTTAVTNPPATATAQPPPTPEPTADLAHPVGIIAIGHSGATGAGTATGSSRDNPTASWATGTEPAVNSIYLRLVAVLPATEGHVANNAQGGASASSLSGQAQRALNVVPAPALAIIQTVDNDTLCDGSNIAEVGQWLADALAVIHAASPNTKILVAGQLGRPSVDFIKTLVAHDPSAKADLTWDDDCSFFDAGGNLRVSGIEKLGAVIDAYEAEMARVCAAVPNCVTDGGVRKAWVDKLEYFSPDWAHLNVLGQAAEAALIWPVVEDLLGL